MASKSKTAQPKPDPVIEQLQRELKREGYYSGDIDGQAGEKTTEAVARRDAARQRNKELEIRGLEAQGNKATSDAEAAAKTAETERLARYNEQASSDLGMATTSGANLLAPALGTALGMGVGSGVNYGMDRAQESRNAVLRGAAEDRMAGRTTVEGAREGVRRAGAMPPSTATGRVVSRMLPQLGLGALSIGKGAQVLNESDPNGEFYPRMADRAAGLGYIGTGVGLAKQGLRYGAAPGVAPDAQALAIINSNQIRRSGLPGGPSPSVDVIPTPQSATLAPPDATPAPSGPAPGTKAYLQQQAKDLGLKGTSKLSKSELAAKLTEALSEHGGKRTVAKRLPKLPGGSGAAALAGGLAYAMTPDEAQAADGTTVGGRGEALTNAGIAGGTAYGVSKLAERLAPVVGGALATGGTMMTPMAAADAYDPTPTQLLKDRVRGAELLRMVLPESLAARLGGAMEDAYQMAQVPVRGDRSPAAYRARDEADIAADREALAQEMPLPQAEALTIPEGIPAPNPDGSSPFPEDATAANPAPYSPFVMGRLSRMQKFGASPEQIAHFLNQAVR